MDAQKLSEPVGYQTSQDRLSARRLAVGDIAPGLRDAMFALFSDYYANVSAARFAADLAAKDFVLLIEDTGRLAGFTTARLFEFAHQGAVHRIVYSGDTIVAREHWGQRVLAQAWLGEMGRIARAVPERRLFWFLIVKGHRTYRYLPAFARSFVPGPCGNAAPELTALRDALAVDMFGAEFDPATGVIRFASPRGNLLEAWAEPSERERRLAEVAYFLAANPGYAGGDELACLTELARGNMRPLARRWFDAA